MSFLTVRWLRLGAFRASRQERRRVRRSPNSPALRFQPLLEVLEDRTVPSTFTVTNLNDSGAGSLRAAVQSADATSGATISFARGLHGTIVLTSGELDLTSSMTINGPGAKTIAVSGDNNSRVFEVAAGAKISLKDLSIIGGNASASSDHSGYGGGVYNGGSMTIADSTLSGSTAYYGGGGVYNGGSLTMADCALSGNAAGNSVSGYGGGIDNNGSMTLRDSKLSGNTSSVYGGGVANFGSMTIRDSTLYGNSALYGGGVANLSGNGLTIRDSILSGNSAGNSGGGVYNGGSLTIRDSTLSGNTAHFGGGGVDNAYRLTIRDSTLSGNSAGSNGGGLYNGGFILSPFIGTATVSDSILSGNSAGSNGGGVYNIGLETVNGGMTIRDSILSGNSASSDGGGVYNIGNLTVKASTLLGNSAGFDGGGIYNRSFGSFGTATLSNCLVTHNTATSGGGIYTTNGTLTLVGFNVIRHNSPDNIVYA